MLKMFQHIHVFTNQRLSNRPKHLYHSVYSITYNNNHENNIFEKTTFFQSVSCMSAESSAQKQKISVPICNNDFARKAHTVRHLHLIYLLIKKHLINNNNNALLTPNTSAVNVCSKYSISFLSMWHKHRFGIK